MVNIQRLSLDKILFIDVETVSNTKKLESLSPKLQEQWTKKSVRIKPDVYKSVEDKYEEFAGIYAEFGKVVCVSLGVLMNNEGVWSAKIHSIYGNDEKQILTQLIEIFEKRLVKGKYEYICGHNIKEFDIPYLCRRILVNGLILPPVLQIAGRKPWELEYIMDTLALWKFGDYKNYTSLDLLMGLFDLPSPKGDIDGSQVSKVYWQDGDVKRIARYCEQDVLSVIRLVCCWNNLDLISEDKIDFSVE